MKIMVVIGIMVKALKNVEIIYMAPNSILVSSLMKSLFDYLKTSDLNIIILSIFHLLFIIFQMRMNT